MTFPSVSVFRDFLRYGNDQDPRLTDYRGSICIYNVNVEVRMHNHSKIEMYRGVDRRETNYDFFSFLLFHATS